MTTFVPPSHEELKQKRLNYLRACKPMLYRELKKDGDLEEQLERAANGGFPPRVWDFAIRTVILDQEGD